MTELNTTPQDEKEESIDIRALLTKYLIYWHWFAISVVVLLIGAWIYLRFEAPVYNVSAAVLIQEEDSRNRNSGSNPMSAIQDLGMFSMTRDCPTSAIVLPLGTVRLICFNTWREPS